MFHGCPACGRTRVRRAKLRGAAEWLLSLLTIVPLRCRYCDHRFFRALIQQPLYAAMQRQSSNGLWRHPPITIDIDPTQSALQLRPPITIDLMRFSPLNGSQPSFVEFTMAPPESADRWLWIRSLELSTQ